MFHPNIYNDGNICIDSKYLFEFSTTKQMESHERYLCSVDINKVIAVWSQPWLSSQSTSGSNVHV